MTWYPIRRKQRNVRPKTTWKEGNRRLSEEISLAEKDRRNRENWTENNWTNSNGCREM